MFTAASGSASSQRGDGRAALAAILVVGQTGQVARCLALTAREKRIPVVSLGRPELDIGNDDSINRAFAKVAPSCVINAAAYTAVDKAEADSDEAYRINCMGAAQLAKAACCSRSAIYSHLHRLRLRRQRVAPLSRHG